MSLTARQRTYADLLSNTVLTTGLFNSGASSHRDSWVRRYVEKIIFWLLLFALTFVAMLAVFARSGIDTSIQFSLYVVPIISLICGHLVFKSTSFKQILSRKVHEGFTESVIQDMEKATRDRPVVREISRILKKDSLKTCFYPLSLVVYQWSAYLIFYYANGNNEFSGPYNISKHTSFLTKDMHFVLSKETWLPMYFIFWTVAMYITGFVGFCVVLLVDIHRINIKTFLYQLGNGPIIQKASRYFPNLGKETGTTQQECNYRYPRITSTKRKMFWARRLFFQMVSLVVGFLTLGLVELIPNALWETQETLPVSRSSDQNTLDHEIMEELVSDNGSSVTEILRSPRVTTECGTADAPQQSVSPREAGELFISFMTRLENNSSLFKPFLVLLLFFSVTNLVTHVVAMAVLHMDGFSNLHWWTLTRTFFWFLLAVRLLWAVSRITKSLSRIIPHIYYLRCVGQLPGDKQEWDNFFQLARTYQLGSKTYGFPLTLNQVASIVAMVNFSFLIVLSLLSKRKI